MPNPKRTIFCSTIVATAILAGLGGVADAHSSSAATSFPAMADRNTATLDPPPAAATDEFSGKKMLGFPNVGATCYANAALKFLIHSMGPGALISHLKIISETEPTIYLTPIQQFIDLIKITHESENLSEDALTSFFHTLDGTGNFFLGKISEKPEGTSYFYSGLANTFNIEKINNGGFSVIRKTIDAYGIEITEKQGGVLRRLNVYEDQLDLQTLVNSYSQETGTSLENQYEFQVSDVRDWKRVNFKVIQGVGVTTNQLNFDEIVTIPVVDKSGNRFIAKLKAKAMVFPTSNGTSVTHYVAYLKYDEPGFSLHNDSQVNNNVQIQENTYPELISFSVESIEAAP